jgi:transcriptional regulator with XRE-family HTH domain
MAADRGLERHELRARLRELRERNGLSQEALADALGWHRSKMHRIEAGVTPISPEDLKSLLAHLDRTPEDVGPLLALARAAARRRPGGSRAALPPSVRRYREYEDAAEEIWNYEPMFVPGLLQVPAYTAALITGLGLRPHDATSLEAVVDARQQRQRLLTRTRPVRLHVLLDESAILRRVGTPGVMARQLEHLWVMAVKPNISLAIVPFASGVHPAQRAPFVVMRFAGQERPGMLFVENPASDVITLAGDDSASDPADHVALFERVSASSLTGAAATQRLRQALDDLREGAS